MSSTAPQPTKINSAWIRYRAVGYLRGKGLSYGCGPEPIVPGEALDLGKYSISVDHARVRGHAVCDVDLGIFSPASLEHVFVGPRITTLTDPETVLKQLVSKLAPGGHCVVHVVASPTLTLDVLRSWLRGFASWQEKDTYEREGQLLGVWKLVSHSSTGVKPRVAQPTKRACIARYGAIGDMIMITPLIQQLAEDGYAVTMNITPYSAEVLKGNPYVSNIVLQERDAIPNLELGQYWAEWANDYDKYINLSESIEGKLLKVEGRREFYTSKSWRGTVCDTNYYDQTMRLGGYPEALGRRGSLYFNSAERRAARHLRDKAAGKFLVVWALKGSSHHKQYPWLRPVLTEFTSRHRDALVCLVGAAGDAGLGWDTPAVFNMAGQVPLREVFALTELADLVVGPESAVINAAGCFSTPKLVLLSHSSHENLCKYWENHTCVEPLAACYPCHQLHYSAGSCPSGSIQDTSSGETVWTGPVCAAGVSPERMLELLESQYLEWFMART